MRTPSAAVLIFTLALSVSGSRSADAAAGFDSSYFGESAFLTLTPGQSGQFAAGFTNTGSSGWQTGTTSQVNLAICLADKVTCSVPSPNSAWASSWYSSIAYATQSTTFVGPGQVGWFVYSVRAPASAAGTTRFNGDLVLNSTGEKLHPEGYYQDATVVAPGSTPTRLDLRPVYQTAKTGAFPTVSARVTGEPVSGTTTRTPLSGYVVSFEVQSTDPASPPLIMTAVSNSVGDASITYTRSNVGIDSVTAYVASDPSLRDTASIQWSLTSSSVSVAPDDMVSMGSTGCRTYTYSAVDPVTGSALALTTLYVNFVENINRTADQDGGATIAGDVTGSPTPTVGIAETTDAAGVGSFIVCGSGANVSLTPLMHDNRGGGSAARFETDDLADSGGTISFQSGTFAVRVTPDEAGSRVIGGQRVFSISVTDQFGTAYTGPVRVAFIETTDGSASTVTQAQIAWIDNDSSPSTATASGGAAPTGTTDIADTQAYTIASLNASGAATFGVFSSTGTTGTPVVWIDSDGDGARGGTEAQDAAGATTWSGPALTSCTLTRSKALASTSGGGSAGSFSVSDVFFVFTYRDQNGAAFDPSPDATVTFSITNTGSANVYARVEAQTVDTVIGPGGSASLATPAVVTDADSFVVLDAATATSASVTATSSAGGVSVSCGPTTIRWVDANPEPSSGNLSGNVTLVEKAGTSDGGGYVLQTAGGSYVITYETGHTFFVSAVSKDEAGFEAALSVGDVLLWSYGGGAESHNITTDNP